MAVHATAENIQKRFKSQGTPETVRIYAKDPQASFKTALRVSREKHTNENH